MRMQWNDVEPVLWASPLVLLRHVADREDKVRRVGREQISSGDIPSDRGRS